MVKSKIKQIGMIILSVLFACTLFFGIRLLVNDKSTLAVSETATVTLTSDKTTVTYGGSFNLTITFTSTSSEYWRSANIYVAPFYNGTKNAKLASYLTATLLSETVPKSTAEDSSGYRAVSRPQKLPTDGELYCGFSKNGDAYSYIAQNTPISFTFKITIAEGMKDDQELVDAGLTEGASFQFDLVKNKDSLFQYKSLTDNSTNEVVGADLASQDVTIGIRAPFSVNELESVYVGYGAIDTAVTDEKIADKTLDGAAVPTVMTYTCLNRDIQHFVMEIKLPSNAGDATVAVNKSPSQTGATALNSDDRVLVDLSPIQQSTTMQSVTVYIFVTAEDGTLATYTLNVYIGYARLGLLSVDTDYLVNGTNNFVGLASVTATADGVIEKLDDSNNLDLNYEVEVPYGPHTGESASQLVVNINIINGYGIKQIVKVTSTGGAQIVTGLGTTGMATTYNYSALTAPTAPSAATALKINVDNIDFDNNPTVVLALQPASSPLVSDVEYTLKLVRKNTCPYTHTDDPENPGDVIDDRSIIKIHPVDGTTIKTDSITGTQDDSGNLSFTLPVDGKDGFAYDITVPDGLTAATGATGETVDDWDIKITVSYTDESTFPPTVVTDEVVNPNASPLKIFKPGEYTVTITPSIGTAETFTMTVSASIFLKFSDSSTFKFIAESEDIEDGESYFYRKTYADLSWTHGVDDMNADGTKKVEEFVIGDIAEMTTLNGFISNISSDQLDMIKLYGYDILNPGVPQLLYSSGSYTGLVDADGGDADDWEMWSIGTGWYIEFGDDGSGNALYTYYLCVLGDLNASGTIDAVDGSDLNDYLCGTLDFDKVYVRLAATITNSGFISTTDASTLNDVLSGTDSVSNYFDNYVPAS